MHIRFSVFMALLCWFPGLVFGEDPGVLRLQSGQNEIPIILHNQSLRSIANLDIDVDSEAPNWVSVQSESIALTPDNSLDRHITKFNLSLFVKDKAEHPDTILPLILTDDLGRTWKIQLHIQVLRGEQGRTALFGNFPNPFNPSTIIRYRLDHIGSKSTTLVIYDTLGQKIRTLVNELQSSGLYEVQWDARDDQGRAAASGVYMYLLQSGSFKQTRSMTLVH
ncbi:MAG: T9SS type A sorting domain-containing protein [Gemmatimonadota bacterium]|nr:T9SS type A sorting domain-containing protein [Gemmatimonadota bacterium]